MHDCRVTLNQKKVRLENGYAGESVTTEDRNSMVNISSKSCILYSLIVRATFRPLTKYSSFAFGFFCSYFATVRDCACWDWVYLLIFALAPSDVTNNSRTSLRINRYFVCIRH
jgi:hypothetical protein